MVMPEQNVNYDHIAGLVGHHKAEHVFSHLVGIEVHGVISMLSHPSI